MPKDGENHFKSVDFSPFFKSKIVQPLLFLLHYFFLSLVLENDGQLEHHGKSVMDVVENVNTSVRLLNCGICLKVFKTQSLLKEHMFVHIKK